MLLTGTTQTNIEPQFMKKLSNTEAELEKLLLIKKVLLSSKIKVHFTCALSKVI